MCCCVKVERVRDIGITGYRIIRGVRNILAPVRSANNNQVAVVYRSYSLDNGVCIRFYGVPGYLLRFVIDFINDIGITTVFSCH